MIIRKLIWCLNPVFDGNERFPYIFPGPGILFSIGMSHPRTRAARARNTINMTIANTAPKNARTLVIRAIHHPSPGNIHPACL
jgi:hypothetical protein